MRMALEASQGGRGVLAEEGATALVVLVAAAAVAKVADLAGAAVAEAVLGGVVEERMVVAKAWAVEVEVQASGSDDHTCARGHRLSNDRASGLLRLRLPEARTALAFDAMRRRLKVAAPTTAVAMKCMVLVGRWAQRVES